MRKNSGLKFRASVRDRVHDVVATREARLDPGEVHAEAANLHHAVHAPGDVEQLVAPEPAVAG